MPKNDLSPFEANKRLKKYGWCRAVTHFWLRSGAIVWDAVEGVYEILLKCQHCGTFRKTYIKSNGDYATKHHHNYTYPEDFLIEGYEVNRKEVRRMAFLTNVSIRNKKPKTKATA